MSEDNKKNECLGIDCFACPNIECPRENKARIIDGVNVADCEFFSEKKTVSNESGDIITIDNACMRQEITCCCNGQECFFKNFQRSEARIRKLETILKHSNKEKQNLNNLCKILKATIKNANFVKLVEENEEYKEQEKRLLDVIEEQRKHLEFLVDAINQGTKKFSYAEAPFLHDAMSKHFEYETGISIDEILDSTLFEEDEIEDKE